MKTNTNWKGLLCVALLAISIGAHAHASDDDKKQKRAGGGNSGIGGGELAPINEASLRQLIKQGTLKAAMLNYLRTIDLAQVPAAHPARPLLDKLVPSGDLARDVETSEYREGSCKDARVGAKACTKIGGAGQPITFDIPAIAAELKDVAGEQGLIRVAALSFHEHAHHFQSPKDREQDNEAQANELAAYVMVTARFAKAPSLEWTVRPGTEPVVTDEWDQRPVGSLPAAFSMNIQDLNLVIPAWTKSKPLFRRKLNLATAGESEYIRYLECSLTFESADRDRTLTGSISLSSILSDTHGDYKISGSHSHSGKAVKLECDLEDEAGYTDRLVMRTLGKLKEALTLEGFRFSMYLPPKSDF